MLFEIYNALTADDADRELRDAIDDSADVDALVKRAQNGDDEAFSALVEIFEKFVYNTAVRYLSAAAQPPDAADDIAQNSFIKAWRSLPSFRGECLFSTWLFRITANSARDYIRHKSRHQTVSLTSSDDENDDKEWDVPVTSGDAVPEDSLEKKELILGVRHAIEQLPDDQRAVVVMRDIHELPYKTIADALGLELGTVKSRLNRGRANLKTILKNGNFI
jgi:RNA polymerase sigma-70 factor, ECF subfamily